jgi:hypothetical protein
VSDTSKAILGHTQEGTSRNAEVDQDAPSPELPAPSAAGEPSLGGEAATEGGESRLESGEAPAERFSGLSALLVRGHRQLSAVRVGITGRVNQQRIGRWAFNNAPVLIFFVIYAFSSLLGALLLLANYRPFAGLFEYFSGTQIPSLSGSQTVAVLMLLCVAPVCLWLGYAIGRRVPIRGHRAASAASWLRAADLDPPDHVPLVVFALSGAVAFITLARAGALSSIPSWLDYGRFINAREALFSRIGFMEFVNIYMFLPFSAAWVMVSWRRPGLRGLLVRWFPVVWVEFIDFLLFQKKTAVVSLLIIMLAALFFHLRNGIPRRRLVLGAWATVLLGVGIYFAAVVAPVYSKASGATVCAYSTGHCTKYGQVPALIVYATLSPITRSSAPVLYYPVVYPKIHPFYGPDLFQDELGLPSHLADDNHDIWKAQYPNRPAGTSVAPFQFSIYAGSGLIGTLVECLIIGGLMGLMWRIATWRELSPMWSSLLAASACLFGLYLAIDSWRNDTTVSYGALWGVLFIGMTMVLIGLFKNRAQRLRTWRGAAVLGLALLLIVGVVRRDYGKLPPYAAATQTGPPGLPTGWSVVPGVTVRPQVGQLGVRTTALPYGYQLISPVLSLDPGSYTVTVTEKTTVGGFDLGVLRESNQTWVRQKAIYGQHPSAAVSVSFSLVRRTGVRVILANYLPGGGYGSLWEIKGISLRSRSRLGLARRWAVGLK